MITKIKENNGGTLNKDLSMAQVTKGYMVSLIGTEEVYNDITIDILTSYASKVLNGFLGVWFNTDNEKYYLDNSVNILNLDDAYQLAKENKQLAIYDIENDKVITI